MKRKSRPVVSEADAERCAPDTASVSDKSSAEAASSSGPLSGTSQAFDPKPRVVSPVVEASPTRFFAEVVDQALGETPLELSSACHAYVVSVLSEHAGKPPDSGEEPFALRLSAALGASGGKRFDHLRRLGDDVLFLGGFFEEHLAYRGLQRNYLVALGSSAYHGAGTALRQFSAEMGIFAELSARFEALLRLLSKVADAVLAKSSYSNASVLELYERWRRTQSNTLAQALAERGLFATEGGTSLAN